MSQKANENIYSLKRTGNIQHAFRKISKFLRSRNWQQLPNKLPKNKNAARSLINHVRDFLNLPSSSPRRSRAIGRKVSKTLKERYGVDIAETQLSDFFSSDLYNDFLGNDPPSPRVLKALGYIKRNFNSIQKQLETNKNITLTVDDIKNLDVPTAEIVEQLATEQNLEHLKDLFNTYFR